MLMTIHSGMFTKNAKVFLINTDTQNIEKTFFIAVKDLSASIPTLCDDYKVNKIIFEGSKKFNQKIGQSIQSNAISRYNLNINIEYA